MNAWNPWSARSLLMKERRQVVLVSSGAVGLGRGWLGLHRSRLEDMVTKQACAAVGQSLLMDAYKDFFRSWGIKIAQVLLTEEDFTNWGRYSSLQHTIEKLLGFGVLPIVNENDTVSTAELESVAGRVADTGLQRQRPLGGAGDERTGSGCPRAVHKRRRTARVRSRDSPGDGGAPPK